LDKGIIMYVDLVKIKYLDGYKLELKFEDGKKGVVDFTPHFKKGGAFRRLRDLEYFKKAYVNKELGVLCWPDGLDIAPETLYSEATGKPLPPWMAEEKQHKKKTRQRKAV
jgi:hypothetical protein